MRKSAVVPPPEVQLSVICVAESTTAPGLVGLGGAPWLCVVALTVTPEEASGAALALIAQILKLYCVSWVRPVTKYPVSVMLVSGICVPDAQLAGALPPA